jgi:phage host-nuclease inhibitor protein Gam
MSTRTKTRALAVPQSMEEADRLLAELGRLEREKRLVQAALDEATAGAKARAEAEAAPIAAAMEELVARIQAWAEANRDALTKGGRTKTVKLPAGTVSWKLGRARLFVEHEAPVIEALRARGDGHLVRVTATLDKAALLAEPAAVQGLPGCAIVLPGEEFEAKPVALPLAEAPHV